ncbi:DUF1499 domain-containing protein [Wenzhouxiangella sp. XN79A]|uniref:DUF1499 domain-containing protein n=1 Tax=Wenzhouxiangella sp. XN79A TaxID=2724193 RepID=UPI00144A62B9|nr:DUF1499 domain-containing protein [Wenzhouxiangella sp. XN79A]NKI33587.1 DUF1499 domain-containing protein [Wenzhouxiangella sp. XN79A]
MILRRLAISLALLALIVLLIGGPGYRLGLWALGFGLLGVMRYALYLGAAGALLAVIGLLLPRVREQGAGVLVLALLLGAVVAAVPVGVRQIASGKPFIHDITTDLEDPPAFVAVVPLRAGAPNPPEYGGADVAEQQRRGYPELGPAIFDRPTEAVFDAAVATVDSMGWERVATVAEDGRIEATDTTLWYGFKDDIVIRIRATPDGTRVDLRSKSRVGGSDLGKNADRIAGYLDRLDARLSG